MSLLKWFHQHRYDLRETRPDGRYLVCQCGDAVPMLKRDKPVTVTPPAHERMKAQPTQEIVISPLDLVRLVDEVWSENMGELAHEPKEKVH